jgi:hypothetical protein
MINWRLDMLKMYSYIVKNDTGFAPNVYGGICTLACCKPQIRSTARIGNWIMGTTPVRLQSGRLIYAMKVGRGLNFETYFNLPEYEFKKPSSENPMGDNIYRLGLSGKLEQMPNNAHCETDLNHDTGVNRVLIADEFYYFGKEAPIIPEQFKTLIQTTQGHKIIEDESVENFVLWLRKQYTQGIHGQPNDN